MARQIKGIIFDIDGCLIRGEQAISGAVETIAELRGRGVKICFLTNGNMDSTGRWVERLTSLGFVVGDGEVLTSLEVAVEHIKTVHPKAKVLPVGTPAMTAALKSNGIEVVDWVDARSAQVVLMGRDPDFSQRRLEIVCAAIWGGAKFIATNLDRRLPVGEGTIPETGPMIKAVAWATSRRPLVVGKPSRTAGKVALKLLGLSAEEALMVGDNVDQDIRMGKALGMLTALVLTGCTLAREVPGLPLRLRSDVVLPDVSHLTGWLDNTLL